MRLSQSKKRMAVIVLFAAAAAWAAVEWLWIGSLGPRIPDAGLIDAQTYLVYLFYLMSGGQFVCSY